MSRTRHTCRGCHAILESTRDMRKEQGTTRRTWKCRVCGTTVPGIVAEKIQHQTES